MTLSISPVLASTAAQAATLDVALQPGTVVTAQVLKLLDANLVRMAIANLTLDVATTLPLQVGQTLQLAVTQTKNGISLAQVLPEATSAPRGGAVVLDDIPLAPKMPALADAVRPALSPAETRAVSVAAQTAATRQTSLSPLFANLASAVTSGSLPQPVLLAAAQLLAFRQPIDRALTGADIKTALASSGLMLEASLASATPRSAGALPDMKAALSVLRQTLVTWLGPDMESAGEPKQSAAAQMPVAAQGDNTRTGLSALLPSSLLEADASDPFAIAKALSTSTGSATGEAVSGDRPPLPRTLTPSPPFRDALPTAQAVAAPSLAPDAEPIVIAQQLIADTDGALARQTLLQIASLPDRVDITMPRNETLQPRWNFEIPFVTPQGTAMAQFEIARDGGNETEAAQRVWRARFSLDIEPAGPVHALISFSGDTTSVKMWAERPATAAQLRANAFQLGASLDRAELKAGDIVIADGAPARGQAPSAGHFLNRAS